MSDLGGNAAVHRPPQRTLSSRSDDDEIGCVALRQLQQGIGGILLNGMETRFGIEAVEQRSYSIQPGSGDRVDPQ